MVERRISQCIHPTCRDVDGNPRMTRDGVCEGCRYRYWQLLTGWLPLDFVLLHETMPKPTPIGPRVQAASSERTFGHPAEWSSDKLSEIAARLNTAEDDLRGYLGHGAAVPITVVEHRRVALAIQYLSGWFNELCLFPAAEHHLCKLDEVHHQIRSALGQTRRETYLPVDCPNIRCGRRALVRYIGDDEDWVECVACGESINSAKYGLYTKWLVEENEDPQVDGMVA